LKRYSIRRGKARHDSAESTGAFLRLATTALAGEG
jgi:hypothetical protein